jgi:competence protein CoiA
VQLIAIDDLGRRVIAPKAQKKINYRCPECRGVVRLRCGPRVQAHFYHHHKPQRCAHRKKSLAHLHNQLYLAEKIPEAILEHPFPSIGRIADVFWPSRNLVFEIQCSAMTAIEAEKRENDYQSLGLDLVWILHEARFNRRRLTAVEYFFLSCTTYYTSIRNSGSGAIYDQFEIVRGDKRCFHGARFPIDPSSPYPLQGLTLPSSLPNTFLQRLQTRTLGFSGDILDTILKKPNYDFSSLVELEKRYASNPSPIHSWIQNFSAVYRAFLYALLEKVLLR